MWRAEREQDIRIVLLSGDRHEFGATRFPDPALNLPSEDLQPNTPGLGLHEFSVGPLSMFYLPIRSYRQTDAEDVTVKYAPQGNSKFGLIDIADEVEDVDPGAEALVPVRSSVLTYSLYVDGEVVWKYRLSVPLVRDAIPHASLSNADMASRLPAGHVLEDRVPELGWNVMVGAAVGRVPELVKWVMDKSKDVYFDLVDRVQKAKRLT